MTSPAINDIVNNLKTKSKIRVLFVCLGNICRSPAAEGMMLEAIASKNQEYRWEVDSVGTGGYHIGDLPDRRMRIHARNRGIELTHICRQVKMSDFDRFDLIIGMDENNLRHLRSMAPSIEAERKIVPMAAFFSPGCRFDHVPDPYYDGADGFETVLDLLADATENLLNAFGPGPR